ncbi:hypothetical protein AAE02nite_08840 [Adhaeribacter aerolatus]|uniref:DUF5672 domain-containing protein n=1 Tax=Adhaeribacter aerolatus TaxID=670289 RepID=A0A512AU59_9BACT|nr:DUF5672 family protein [Adhaeribacter aerolatus]GEO03220.1 hypothetical protein AAE02nite_08840 [Adhaeribacter aerolatus]
MQSDLKCVVVIPVYKKFNQLIVSELASLQQVLTVFIKRDIFLVAPNLLDCQPYLDLVKKLKRNVGVLRFDDHFFRSTDGYNELMLSLDFYECFTKYDYLLVAQTDSWVFRDDLDLWCSKGIDYVGAPWPDEDNLYKIINNKKKWFFRFSMLIQKAIGRKNDWRVGNGGFCLHNIQSSIKVLRWFNKLNLRFSGNEDLFWGIYIPLIWPFFKVPDELEAVAFAFEKNPEKYFKLNKSKLPFGCHAWEKYNPSFWKQWIYFEN